MADRAVLHAAPGDLAFVIVATESTRLVPNNTSRIKSSLTLDTPRLHNHLRYVSARTKSNRGCL
ncbi:hypothetical protein BN2476_630007 [Paraburkholderia piptadeniae]|uniref:Uncharacterized protein n=1 Tax=Paraburkholderia piptadeniae TaxID=1701573 RepID=A0A1N7SLE5_9BURK|nr:hypothetical protein BN2476_630007 [Paraburkholderia piptadeniae]